MGFYQHKAHFKVRVEEKASQRSKQYPSVLVDHAYLWSGFNPKVCQYIWNVKWIRYCKEQIITLCQQGLKVAKACVLTPHWKCQHQLSLRLIKLFSLCSMMSKGSIHSASMSSAPLHILTCLGLTSSDLTPCQLHWVLTATELPRELMGVTISLGFSITLVLNKLSVCHCLGYAYWGLQLVGLREIQNFLCYGYWANLLHWRMKQTGERSGYRTGPGGFGH